MRVLEVGHGSNPMSFDAFAGQPGFEYVGVDSRPNAYRSDESTNHTYLFWDAVNMELFPDNVFDIVAMRDVYGLMKYPLWPTRERKSFWNFAPAEFFRVLKPGGKIVVIEYGTPERPEDLVTHLHQFGFDTRALVAQYNEESWQTLEDMLDGPIPHHGRDPEGVPYILVAEKPFAPELVQRRIEACESAQYMPSIMGNNDDSNAPFHRLVPPRDTYTVGTPQPIRPEILAALASYPLEEPHRILGSDSGLHDHVQTFTAFEL